MTVTTTARRWRALAVYSKACGWMCFAQRHLHWASRYRSFSSTVGKKSTCDDTVNAHGATLNPIPASFLRGGTSKGVFIHRKYLPPSRSDWTPIFLGIMGSPDPEHGRQLNGMGGGVSSLSKICVLGEPSAAQQAEGIDVEYTFAQIPIRDTVVDYSGNCGNLSSMIGVCAVDFGICEPKLKASELHGEEWRGTVRSFNINTQKVIDTTFPIARGPEGAFPLLDLPQAVAAGVPGRSSRIDLEFVSPGGARTGKLLPTGSPVDVLRVPGDDGDNLFRISLVDATNPSVFILTSDIQRALQTNDVDFSDARVEGLMEGLRQRGAELMRLDPNAKAQPKICALSPPSRLDTESDIVAHAYSMGVLHKAIPMTLGLCLGVAAQVQGTIASDILDLPPRSAASTSTSTHRTNRTTKIRHASGVVEVGATFSEKGEVDRAMVVRTGRRLMHGVVWW